jgi:hypothetical protein
LIDWLGDWLVGYYLVAFVWVILIAFVTILHCGETLFLHAGMSFYVRVNVVIAREMAEERNWKHRSSAIALRVSNT